MPFRKFILIIFLFCALHVSAQDNFSYSPEMPQAGDIITFTYTPAGALANLMEPVKARAFTLREKGEFIPKTDVQENGRSYIIKVTTDTADRMVFLKFFSGDSIDNNQGKGYWVRLYNGDQPIQGANISLSDFYSYFGADAGVKKDDNKTLLYMEKEFELYPVSKKEHQVAYLRLYTQVHPEKGPQKVQEAIEAAMKAGLKDEDDYTKTQNLYALNKLTQQADFIDKLKQKKFPDGKWTIRNTITKFLTEKDADKKMEMWKEMAPKFKSDPDWKVYQQSVPFFKTSMLNGYIQKSDWDGLMKQANVLGMEGSSLASLYNNTAWELQEKDKDLKVAEEMALYAVTRAKSELDKPATEKPAATTLTQWKAGNKNDYAMYADTYAMVNYKLGNYKKGLQYATISTLDINKGTGVDYNNTYALLASKVLSPKKYIPQLADFVKKGHANKNIKDLLEKAYLKKHSKNQTQIYMADLEKISHMNMLKELEKKMLDKESPAFALKDIDGNSLNSDDLKGKVVILDFWATWCGPCKASFPGMQKMVAKYKDDPQVKFFFVDTWENGGDKEKNASAFIKANKYDFHVLMDNEDKVVKKFGISGIPTKFILDKSGKIRFKSVGYGGSTEGLVKELSAMIELAKGT